MKPAVFADRDGTLCEEVNYLGDPDKLVMLPGAAKGVAMLNAAGIAVVVVTNQSGVARGYFSENDVVHVNDKLIELLAIEGARVDGVYYCPHHEEKGLPPYNVKCDCRKPAPGLILKAARELNLDLSHSFVAGDKMSDIGAAPRAGCVGGVLVETGYGGSEPVSVAADAFEIKPIHTAPDFHSAAKWIIDYLTKNISIRL
jgi:D-glycero-D-manno-heptose 1,7-bisphosphate phosphatase